MLALVEAGQITPRAEDVAVRAAVGLRSVFRHFKDMDSLYAEMAQRLAQGYQASLSPFKSTLWRDQLFEAIDRRLMVYERLLPFKRAADAHRHESPIIQQNHEYVIALLRARLSVILPPAHAADPMIFETIDMLLSFDVWQRLRIEQRLPAISARSIVEAQVAALID